MKLSRGGRTEQGDASVAAQEVLAEKGREEMMQRGGATSFNKDLEFLIFSPSLIRERKGRKIK